MPDTWSIVGHQNLHPNSTQVRSVFQPGALSLDAHLPELPEFETAGFLPAIRTQIEEAERAARAQHLGRSLTAFAEWDQADALYQPILAGHPDLPQAWYGLGQLSQSNYGQAEAAFRRALVIHPNCANLGAIYEQQGRYALACARAGDREHGLRYFQKAHDGASARGQSQLLLSIDRDLKMLESKR